MSMRLPSGDRRLALARRRRSRPLPPRVLVVMPSQRTRKLPVTPASAWMVMPGKISRPRRGRGARGRTRHPDPLCVVRRILRRGRRSPREGSRFFAILSVATGWSTTQPSTTLQGVSTPSQAASDSARVRVVAQAVEAHATRLLAVPTQGDLVRGQAAPVARAPRAAAPGACAWPPGAGAQRPPLRARCGLSARREHLVTREPRRSWARPSPARGATVERAGARHQPQIGAELSAPRVEPPRRAPCGTKTSCVTSSASATRPRTRQAAPSTPRQRRL